MTELELSAQEFRGGKLVQSKERMRRFQRLNEGSIDCLINVSTIQMVEGNGQQAVNMLKKAREMDPFDFRAYYNLFVLNWRVNKEKSAISNLRKCISLFYSLSQTNLDRSLQLWPGNTASHAIKIVLLIKDGKIDKATNAISKALKLSITKHHILLISNILDAALNKRADRSPNKGNSDNSPFLLPVPSLEEPESHQQNSTIQELVTQFNKVSKEMISKNQYSLYSSQPSVLFMRAKNRTSIDIQKYVSESLGALSLKNVKHSESDNVNRKQLHSNQQKKQMQFSKQHSLYPITNSQFQIKLLKANLKIGYQIQDMHPYVDYEYGCQKYKCNIVCSKSLKQYWQSEGKIFSLQKNPTFMKVTFYQRQIFKWDEEVGTGQFQIIAQGQHTQPIYFKEKPIGRALFSILRKN